MVIKIKIEKVSLFFLLFTVFSVSACRRLTFEQSVMLEIAQYVPVNCYDIKEVRYVILFSDSEDTIDPIDALKNVLSKEFDSVAIVWKRIKGDSSSCFINVYISVVESGLFSSKHWNFRLIYSRCDRMICIWAFENDHLGNIIRSGENMTKKVVRALLKNYKSSKFLGKVILNCKHYYRGEK